MKLTGFRHRLINRRWCVALVAGVGFIVYFMPTASGQAPTITSLNPASTRVGGPNATVGTAYSQQLAVSGGNPPYSWSVGSLPPGLTLNSTTGVIGGAPTDSGSFNFTVQVTDSARRIATKTFDVTVNPPVLTVTTPSPLPAGMEGTAYSQQLAATGGTPPYTWALSAGSLPAGLDLNPSGLISGTPASPGNFNFTARVTDTDQRTASPGIRPRD